jgi:integrase
MIKLFSNKTHLISLDRSSYFNYFKQIIVKEEGFGKYGIATSHDLRDMCINYHIHTKGFTPTEISQLTRHSIQTLESYYLHRNKKISIQLSEKLKTKTRYGEVKQNIRDGKK